MLQPLLKFSLFYVPLSYSAAECKIDPTEAPAGCWGAVLVCGHVHALPLGQMTESVACILELAY